MLVEVRRRLLDVKVPVLDIEDHEEQNHMAWSSLRMMDGVEVLRMIEAVVDCKVEMVLTVEVGLRRKSLVEVEEHSGLLPFLNHGNLTW